MSESFKSLFLCNSGFVLELIVFTLPLNKGLWKHLLFTYLINFPFSWTMLMWRAVMLWLYFSLKTMFWSSDGSTQALGTCLRDFRNKPYPVRAKIIYYKKTLTVGENTLKTEHQISICYLYIYIWLYVTQFKQFLFFFLIRSWSTMVSLQTKRTMSSAQKWITWSFLLRASLAFQLPPVVWQVLFSFFL